MDTNKPRCRPGLQTDQLSWKPRKLKSDFGDRGDGWENATRTRTRIIRMRLCPGERLTLTYKFIYRFFLDSEQMKTAFLEL